MLWAAVGVVAVALVASTTGRVGRVAVAANGVFQRLSVRAGDSRISFAFSPPDLVSGWLAFGGGVGALVLVSVRRRRR